MSLSFAPYHIFGLEPLTSLFVQHAVGPLRGPMAGDGAKTGNRAGQEEGRGKDSFGLNPPDDSVSSVIRRVAGKLMRGEPVRALDQALSLLNRGGNGLDGIKDALISCARAGLDTLKVMGWQPEVAEYSRALQPFLADAMPEEKQNPKPAPSVVPSPAFAF
jgi:hypothetical protein